MKTQDELVEVISNETIRNRVKELGDIITKDHAGNEIVVVGILKGAFIFMADLVRNINLNLELDFIRLKSYGAKTESSGTITLTKDVELDLTDKHIIVVEDIVDTGYTLQYLIEILKLHKAASIKICCLINKKERRRVEIDVNYVGFDISEGFLVGYGLDFNERYRHLNGIFHLNPGYAPISYTPSDR
jgi:hypoxanthine phosphoribosyltransferase